MEDDAPPRQQHGKGSKRKATAELEGRQQRPPGSGSGGGGAPKRQATGKPVQQPTGKPVQQPHAQGKQLKATRQKKMAK